jgi:hypothetical protein
MLRVDVTRCGSCTTAFLPAMFRYPRCYESVRGSAGPIGSGDAHGIFPFAVLFLGTRFRNVSAALSPHAVGWASTSIYFYRGIDRLILFAAAGSDTARSSSVWGPRFTHIHTKNGRSRKSTSASGFTPRAQSVSRHHQRCGGAILPWVLPLPGVRAPR